MLKKILQSIVYNFNSIFKVKDKRSSRFHGLNIISAPDRVKAGSMEYPLENGLTSNCSSSVGLVFQDEKVPFGGSLSLLAFTASTIVRVS